MRALLASVVAHVPGTALAADELDCDQVFRMSAGAMYRYAQGVPESRMRAALAPRGPDAPTLANELHDVIDEIYAHPAISPIPYGIYRSERCERVKLDLNVPGPYPVVREELDRCAEAGIEMAMVNCAMRVLESNQARD